ncbi:Carbamoyl-phosphate synthase [Mycena kentingensis (nom. inval.)]|nr:Carbamoyl-phosphate synthase [Mycena kentingensis (nom. inval.)]
MHSDNRKREREQPTIPTLIYAAPGHKRFAKLFTEKSLDQVKQVVQKRLNLASTADLSLFYNTDIALENDDDFEAFMVHTEMVASTIDVVVELHAQPIIPPPPVVDNSISVILEKPPVDSGPPNKKRKLVNGTPQLDSSADDDQTVPPSISVARTQLMGPPPVPAAAAQKTKKLKAIEPSATPSGAGTSKQGAPVNEQSKQPPLAPSEDDGVSAPEGKTKAPAKKKKEKEGAANSEDTHAPKPKATQKKAKAATDEADPSADPASAKPAKPRKVKGSASDALVNGLAEKPKGKKKAEIDATSSADPKPPRKTKKAVEGDGSTSEKAKTKAKKTKEASVPPPHNEEVQKFLSELVKARASKTPAPEHASASPVVVEPQTTMEKEKSKPQSKSKPVASTSASNNVTVPRPETGRASDASVGIADRKVLKAQQVVDDDSSSSDSEFAARSRRKIANPLPVGTADQELDAIIRGNGPRMSIDDLGLEDDDDDDEAEKESVVLEVDNEEEDRRFRRRSGRQYVPSSSDEEDGVEESNADVNSGPEPQRDAQPAVVSPTRSPTIPLTAIDSYQTQSVPIDDVGDSAALDALASDNAMFGLETTVPNEGATEDDNFSELDNQTPTPPPKLSPANFSVTPKERRTTNEEDPILPADDFPPSPIRSVGHFAPSPAATRNGKARIKLTQLEPPTTISPPKQASLQNEKIPELVNPLGETASQPAPPSSAAKRSIRETRSQPPNTAVEATEPPPKRRRGPNKTPEERAAVEAAKQAAREERERLKQEKALAKAAGTVKKGATKKKAAASTASQASVADDDRGNAPASVAAWTVLAREQSTQEEEMPEDSLRDELESSPKIAPVDAEENDSEDEIASKLVQTPAHSQGGGVYSQYRRLTEITSDAMRRTTQRWLGTTSQTPAAMPKKKKADLYGDAGSSSESSGDEVVSHIPKSRRAGGKR